MAAIAPFPRAALVKVEVDFTSNWNAASPSYTDVTADVRFASGVTWERGRNDEFQTVSPGSSQFALNNRTRTYDPTTNSNMVPARPTRITCYYPTTSTVFHQMELQVEDWVVNWSNKYDAVVRANCIERWGALGFVKIISAGFGQQTEAQMLTNIAAGAGWPSGLMSFTGGSIVPATSLTGSTALEGLNAVAASFGHLIYEDRSGVLHNAGLFAATGSNGGTFGDNAGEMPFVVPDGGVGQGYWYTLVEIDASKVSSQGGQGTKPVTKAVGSNYPISKYGSRTYTVSAAGTPTQILCDSIATSLNALAPYRLQQVQIRPMVDPAVLFPVVLAADLGIPYTFNFQPPGGGSRISITAKLRSIRHEINETDWLVTWQLSP